MEPVVELDAALARLETALLALQDALSECTTGGAEGLARVEAASQRLREAREALADLEAARRTRKGADALLP